ncbi:MAG TPA: efflux RND transporter periplasmic adaptor subunit [Candidatus Polarisedimenticolia bacterium]|nr:efflux RND transporter periplasmic adaptor subunit [Candidatus Polarisedimenticolia bacterium]
MPLPCDLLPPRRASLILLLFPAAVAAACSGDPSAKPGGAAGGKAGEEVRVVRVEPAAEAVLPRVVSVTGTLAAEEQAAVGMKVAGRLSGLAVDLGSHVAAGDELARVVSTDFELRVRQAEAALQQARSRLGLDVDGEQDAVDPEQTSLVRQARAVLEEATLTRDRARRLFEQELVARADLDAAEAAWQVADGRHQDAYEEILNRRAVLAQRRSELELARQQLRDTVLRAPFDGAVRERHASPGEFISPGQAIVTLVRVHPLRLKLAVPEREAAGVKQGQTVGITVEGSGAVHEGRVARLSPAIDEGSRTLMVEAEVPNLGGALRPGSFASAEIVVESGRPAVLVPASAIVTFAGIEKVILVEDGRAVEKRVRTGRRAGGQVEILEGIAAGAPVVAEPGNLAAGQAVRVAG